MHPRTFSAIQSFAVRYGLGITLVIVWEYAARKAGSIFFPPPSDILHRAVTLWLSGPPSRLFLSGSVLQDVIPSLLRLLGGWALAVLVGVPLGILIGRSRNLSEFFNPALQFLRAIPGPALIPVFIILLGTESTMRVTLIAFGCVWPILLNTIEGTRTVDPVQLDTVKAFRIPRHARLWRIVLPAAMPKIFAGMRGFAVACGHPYGGQRVGSQHEWYWLPHPERADHVFAHRYVVRHRLARFDWLHPELAIPEG
jgi:ABC-type nitrate/sulfonate/bicarbonate transport system permease component